MIRVRFIVWVLLFLLATSAHASYLRLVPLYQVTINTKQKTVAILWTVRNDGDEPADAVTLEFPLWNETVPVSPHLNPHSISTQTVRFPFSKLGITKRGDYALAYRISYKDQNMYPFSAPYLATLSFPPGIPRVLEIKPEKPMREMSLPVDRTKKVRFRLRNLSQDTLFLEKSDLMAPAELPITTDLPMPIQFHPGEEKKICLTLHASEALIGSVYVVGVIFSGAIRDAHFSQPLLFSARITEGPSNIRVLLMVFLAAVCLALFVGQFMRKSGLGKRP